MTSTQDSRFLWQTFVKFVYLFIVFCPRGNAWQLPLRASNETNNCRHSPYRSKFTAASCGFPATARHSCDVKLHSWMLVLYRETLHCYKTTTAKRIEGNEYRSMIYPLQYRHLGNRLKMKPTVNDQQLMILIMNFWYEALRRFDTRYIFIIIIVVVVVNTT